MPVTISGSVSISGSFSADPAAPLVATAGATSTVSTTVNVAITNFSPFASVTGGNPPYTYSVSSGTLPTGITLNASTGVVSGTPTAVQAAANVTFAVRDFFGNQAVTTVTVSFTVLALTIQYLVVGGGGGAASNWGGGGGAGGLLTGNVIATAGSPLIITVGAGGTNSTPGTPGNNSIIYNLKKF